ncbi:MAG TPA: hypothetical protein VLE21_05200 [Candidatus Nitrosocosmicus sp.]|nr:hypothetical protein [Candidatus Nitrosocosmicus sp.]
MHVLGYLDRKGFKMNLKEALQQIVDRHETNFNPVDDFECVTYLDLKTLIELLDDEPQPEKEYYGIPESKIPSDINWLTVDSYNDVEGYTTEPSCIEIAGVWDGLADSGITLGHYSHPNWKESKVRIER